MSVDDFKDSSLTELARVLAGIKQDAVPPPSVDLSRLMQTPVTQAPPPKDLKSPLTKKWNPGFYRVMNARLNAIKYSNRKRILSITKGLTMPDIKSVSIGSAKKMEAAILFFDLENFTSESSRMSNEDILYILNIIIPMMMYIVRSWKGEIEKNTGDGLMAIFGTETRNSYLIARDAIESAMTMKYMMMNNIHNKLFGDNLPMFNFRIGIDMGDVLISRIGIDSLNFLTVVGSAANRASKLQQLANPNGICIGNNMYNNLAPILHSYCNEGESKDWTWKYKETEVAYKFFHYTAEWPDPKIWLKTKL